MAEHTAFVGPRLRRLRRELGITQAAMAQDLDVSASYIALIERNHRPISAELLIRLAETYNVDIASFRDADGDAIEHLQDALTDPVFTNVGITRDDLRDLSAVNPALTDAVASLYQSYQSSQRAVMESRASGAEIMDPLEDARQFITKNRNYFPALDQSGEEIAHALSRFKGAALDAVAARLKNKHSLELRILPADIMAGAYRRYDRHRRQIAISEALDQASRVFQAILQVILLECGNLLDQTTGSGEFETEAGQRLARAALANYIAAAVIFPYRTFHQSAEELKYDLEALSRRFGASFEQVAHRLTTLQRPGLEGVPFFFLRIDAAGNVSKRFSAGVFPFARFGGSCPLWNVHETFRIPRKIQTQIIQLPDGDTYFSLARTVHGGGAGYGAPKAERAVALGCELKHANRLIYARSMDLNSTQPTPIGVTCRLCPRPDCAARAHPPLERRLIIDEYRQLATPFSFAFD